MMSNKVFVPFAIALVAFFWILLVFFTTINTTPSMPRGLYLTLPVSDRVSEGDIVVFQNPMPDGYMGMELGDTPLLKYVVAVSEDGSQLLVRGETASSYDSRFFGPLDTSAVISKAYPLLTESGPVGDHIISHLLSKEKEE